MSMQRPTVTVLMAVYNGQRYLSEAIESVLHQTYDDFEFIIVDDGSTDASGDILRAYAAQDSRIALLRHEQNIGLTKSLNEGLSIAQGVYLARQDADDLSLPGRLEAQVTYLEAHPAVGLLGTAYSVINGGGECLATYRHPQVSTEILWQMLFHNAFCHTSVMWCRNLVEMGGGWYDERLLYSQDYELWVRLMKSTAGANLDLPLVAWRQHDANIDATSRIQQQDLANVIAWKQICGLLKDKVITQDQVRSLREWYWVLPSRLSASDLPTCRLYLNLLDAFGKQSRIDPSVLSRIRQSWVTRIFESVAIDRIGHAKAAGLIASLVKHDRWAVARSVSHRMVHTFRRTLRSQAWDVFG
ncbi:MAG: glycosyltransferase [Nitrospirota bacterium]